MDWSKQMQLISLLCKKAFMGIYVCLTSFDFALIPQRFCLQRIFWLCVCLLLYARSINNVGTCARAYTQHNTTQHNTTQCCQFHKIFPNIVTHFSNPKMHFFRRTCFLKLYVTQSSMQKCIILQEIAFKNCLFSTQKYVFWEIYALKCCEFSQRPFF